jgi:hypothetical protein
VFLGGGRFRLFWGRKIQKHIKKESVNADGKANISKKDTKRRSGRTYVKMYDTIILFGSKNSPVAGLNVIP